MTCKQLSLTCVQVCRNYLNGTGLVWFNMSQDILGGWMNEQITAGLWEEMVLGLKEPCRSAAEKLLCTYAFPQCQLRDGFQVGLPLCKEDCVAVRQLFCYNDWSLIEDNKQRGIYFKSRGHFKLPDCKSLPSFRGSNPPSCSHAKLTEMKTKEGLECQHWDSQTPHSHDRPPNVFPEIQNSSNYCRNAGGEEPSPWCYTMNPKVRWQRCDIPICENVTEADETDEVGSKDLSMETFFTPMFILILSAVGLAGLVIILLLFLLCHRLYKHRMGYNPTSTREEVNIDLDKLPNNMAYHRTGAQLNPKLEKLEFPRNDIIYIRDLGQGAFGRVFQNTVGGTDLFHMLFFNIVPIGFYTFFPTFWQLYFHFPKVLVAVYPFVNMGDDFIVIPKSRFPQVILNLLNI
ncbi:Tyrosine-protein kinase transmembrane receptor Ror2 [Blattella germanica]|nr:Tyrosine-protein kinase transmembrane receptor Ror2 [Blattella germanica]